MKTDSIAGIKHAESRQELVRDIRNGKIVSFGVDGNAVGGCYLCENSDRPATILAVRRFTVVSGRLNYQVTERITLHEGCYDKAMKRGR